MSRAEILARVPAGRVYTDAELTILAKVVSDLERAHTLAREFSICRPRNTYSILFDPQRKAYDVESGACFTDAALHGRIVVASYDFGKERKDA